MRNETWLDEALQEMASIRADLLSHMAVKGEHRCYNKNWVDALQTDSMLQYLELVARASRLRTESRGPHYRTDYPQTDNVQWLMSVVVKQVDHQAELRKEPVPITTYEPPREVFDYVPKEAKN